MWIRKRQAVSGQQEPGKKFSRCIWISIVDYLLRLHEGPAWIIWSIVSLPNLLVGLIHGSFHAEHLDYPK